MDIPASELKASSKGGEQALVDRILQLMVVTIVMETMDRVRHKIPMEVVLLLVFRLCLALEPLASQAVHERATQALPLPPHMVVITMASSKCKCNQDSRVANISLDTAHSSVHQ